MSTLLPKSYSYKTIRLSTLLLCMIGLVILNLAACDERRNVDLTAEDTPVCNPYQIDEWKFIQEWQMGVAGRDPVGERIGSIDAFNDRPWPVPNQTWGPYWSLKETLCGTLENFNFNDTWGDEDDWNNYIVPSDHPRFTSLLTYPISITSRHTLMHQFHKCVDYGAPPDFYCMEAEITPDQAFFGNPWFPRVHGNDEDSSPFEGGQLCTYGPYVADFTHGGRPEIHPSELYWKRSERDEFSSATTTTLMLLHDDSERFNRTDDFALPDSVPDGWRPWAAAPRTGEFNLAFEATIGPLGNETLIFDITEASAPFGRRAVITSKFVNAHIDADDGREHALTYNGQVAVRVNELQSEDNDIGVKFTDVCRIDHPFIAQTRLLGYVTLTSMVGENDSGGEGFHVLHVRTYSTDTGGKLDLPPVAVSREAAQASLDVMILPESIHAANVAEKTEILADVQVRLIGNDPKIVRVQSLAGDQRQELVFSSVQRAVASNESIVVVKDVSVVTIEQLELTTESGMVFHLSVPPITLAPSVITESALQTHNDPAAWNSMVAATGGNLEESIRPPARLQKVSHWQLDVFPEYAPMKDGQAYREDDSPVSDKLNEIINRGYASRLEEFFGSARPFSVEWSYEAKNLTTGEMVLVNSTGNAASNEVQVQMLQDESLTESLKIAFPEEPENTLFELIVTVRMKDTLGNTGEVQHILWSHALVEEDSYTLVESLIPTVAVLAGISPDELLAAGSLVLSADEGGLMPLDSKHRIAGMLRMSAIQAAEDQRISVSELAGLIRGARLFGANND